MYFEKLSPETYYKAHLIKAFPSFAEKALKYQDYFCDDPTRVIYLISSREYPVGICVLGKIIPGDTAEFGIACEPQIAIRAGVQFLRTAFIVYKFKTIYSIPIDDQAEKALIYGGFAKQDNKYIIDFKTLEGKWG